MIVFRQSQMDRLIDLFQVHFEQELAAHFLREYPRECRQAGGREQIEKLVAAGVRKARKRGYESRTDVSLYIALQFILGTAFDKDPQIPWTRSTIPNPSLRIQFVYGQTIDYLNATAGNNCGHVVRALIRLRDWNLDTSPALGPTWKQNMFALLRSLYPQKFDHQGEEANGFLLDDSLSRCQLYYRIQSPQGQALFSILMFMLGTGFDVDHLHPWAARILQDRLLVTDQERVYALYQAAQDHLAQSLTGDELAVVAEGDEDSE